jgi:prepilin-type N-terminal cleavage/methylation domain-containing protein
MKRSFRFLRPAARRGLTLMELVVVMVILAAVAGIVLPLLPSMISRAHTSTGATNISELAKAVQTHQATYYSYPDNLDSLVTGTGAVATYLPGNASTDFAILNATAGHVDSLQEAGITRLAQMVESAGGDWNPTFYPYGSNSTQSPAAAPISTTIAAGTPMMSLTTTAKQRLGLATDANTTYVLFGIGGYTTMQGKTLQEAPVHFADKQSESPNRMYGRFGMVFQVTSGTNSLPEAKLAQIVAFHDEGLVNLGDHLNEYHQATAQ